MNLEHAMIIKKMHEMGIRSEHAYLAGVASIGLTVAAWIGSLKMEPGTGLDRADRWGIFVGEWAPTFFGLGLALSHYEQQDGTLTANNVHELRERQKAG
ncbi:MULTISPECIES: hypothetical protein [Streptomyces]|uniref:Uncharacterized protein n=2 Tax=Streptomyces TaxID=1883 RepID=A0A117QJ33_STRCK|nr:hypothetical protein [Streptomyces corchorusii]AEY93544.1 hypothetical protein SHJG_8278 [Streptomyces hygroscopicus subsp. jinggangensis 5008]AGF67701.1 hypothetical protein SHJGH_8039 [Streptomyces hygroscopicus subsp. jinggangensis TL01]KUN31139.1 hypothetical protein AQJ11_08415 [Streptomyces corchorusii]